MMTTIMRLSHLPQMGSRRYYDYYRTVLIACHHQSPIRLQAQEAKAPLFASKLCILKRQQHRGFYYSAHHMKQQQQQNQQQHLPHDLGGRPDKYGTIIPQDGENFAKLSLWEQECHAVISILGSKSIIKVDELRRHIEDLTPSQYESWTYYERWTAGVTSILLQNRTIKFDELEIALFGTNTQKDLIEDDDDDDNKCSKFDPGDNVCVRPYLQGIEWRRPHIRVPGYIYGVCGSIVDVCGRFGDPSYLSFGLQAPQVWLYRVRFNMKDIWPEQSTSNDEISIEIYENWLEPSSKDHGHSYQDIPLLNHDDDGRDCMHQRHHHQHHHHHHSDDTDDHSHDPRPDVEYRAVSLEEGPRPGKALFRAITRILVDKGLVTYDEIRTMTEKLENARRDLIGADLIVEAWTDPIFKENLLKDPAMTARTIGIETSNPNAPTVLSVVANDSKVHNLVVCTLCSCYPSGLLGIAPSWYKSSEYRSRAVREPRSVLNEFGTNLPSDKVVRIHDSTADHRYLVLLERPKGTEGWTKQELRNLVTRDSMIGVTIPDVET